ncbi:MAG: tripartite tricarboxylate transporter permease, partial [Chloroflexi bacterium]|nr:tripartite tricarboxylate transporter permease [Chloroflexota bacterium]
MEAITTALGYLLDPVYWFVLLSVVLLAALASAIPGMNAFLVMALAFPFILFEVDEPAIGLVALATISGVSNTLDSVPAILIGQPSAATQVTFLEGHQLARRGYAAHTLGAVYAVSALGGIVGAALLTIAIPVARPFVLRFGFPEIAATGMVGIAMVIVLSRGAMVRGL